MSGTSAESIKEGQLLKKIEKTLIKFDRVRRRLFQCPAATDGRLKSTSFVNAMLQSVPVRDRVRKRETHTHGNRPGR